MKAYFQQLEQAMAQTPSFDGQTANLIHLTNVHTKYGVDLASQIEGFPEVARVVIAQHHELRDGSGYPKGLKGSCLPSSLPSFVLLPLQSISPH